LKKVYYPPYCPEIYGKAEKIMNTLKKISQNNYIFGPNYQKTFWDFTTKHYWYIYISWYYISGSNNLVPDEVFYNKTVNIKHLRTFGYVCYYKNQNSYFFFIDKEENTLPVLY